MPTTFIAKNPSKNPIAGTGGQALDLIGSILASSTEYSHRTLYSPSP